MINSSSTRVVVHAGLCGSVRIYGHVGQCLDYDCEPKTYCQINLLKRNRKDSLFMEEQTNAFVEELTVEKQQIHTGETLG